MGLSSSTSALALSFLNGAALFGRVGMGLLSDRFDPWAVGLATLAATSATVFVLWGVLSHSLAGLLAFGIVYGFLASGWSSLFSAFIRPFARECRVVNRVRRLSHCT